MDTKEMVGADVVAVLFDSLGFSRLPSTSDQFHIEYTGGFLVAAVHYENGVVTVARRHSAGHLENFSELTLPTDGMDRQTRNSAIQHLFTSGVTISGVSHLLGVKRSTIESVLRSSK
jgi:hypothetical protein